MKYGANRDYNVLLAADRFRMPLYCPSEVTERTIRLSSFTNPYKWIHGNVALLGHVVHYSIAMELQFDGSRDGNRKLDTAIAYATVKEIGGESVMPRLKITRRFGFPGNY